MQAKFTYMGMKFFAMPNLNIYSFPKKFLQNSSKVVCMVLKELLGLSDDLANQSFC